MPTVLGLTPTAQPSTQGTPEFSLPVPVDAFGGAVGHALQGLGDQIEHSSDQIWQQAVNLQNLQNETDAKEADAKYMMESGKLHADFLNKEGVNAGPEALAKHIQDLQDLRTQIRGPLNPMAAKMYDASSLSFMGRNIFNAAGHSGQQIKVAANNAASARIDMASNNIGDNPTDSIGFQRGVNIIRSEVEAQGRNNGWTPEQTKATSDAQVSTAVAKRIAGLARTDAIGAKAMFDSATKSGSLSPVDASRVEATVMTQFRIQGSRSIADKVLADRRAGEEDDKPEDYYVDAAQKEAVATAKRLGITDPGFVDSVRDTTAAKYQKQKTIERDSDNQNLVTIGKAMMKARSEGIPPTTIDELRAADPAVGPAWDALGRNPAKQQAILKQLERNARSPQGPTVNQENLQVFHTFRGQAMGGTDEERAGFMAQNFAVDNRLTFAQRNQLMTIQDQMRKAEAVDDPRVHRAMQFIRSDLEDAKITMKGSDEQRKDYFQFIGALQDELQGYNRDHPGKMITPDEAKTIGRQLLQQQVTGRSRFLGLGTEQLPFYQLPAPEAEAERIRNDPYWAKYNITPNDNMIARVYRAQKFKELYGGSTSKPAEAAWPVNRPPEAPKSE